MTRNSGPPSLRLVSLSISNVRFIKASVEIKKFSPKRKTARLSAKRSSSNLIRSHSRSRQTSRFYSERPRGPELTRLAVELVEVVEHVTRAILRSLVFRLNFWSFAEVERNNGLKMLNSGLTLT